MSQTRSRLIGAALATSALTLLGTAQAHAISNGNQVEIGQYSFTAAFDQGDKRCSGALVDPQWVITSAACFDANPQEAGVQLESGKPAQRTTVRFGGLSRQVARTTAVEVAEFRLDEDRDVLMARLTDPVYEIKPLEYRAAPVSAGELVRATGYGRTSTEIRPERMHTAQFSTSAPGANNYGLTPFNPTSAGICDGDFGGPTFRERNGVPELVGVHTTSGQQGCAGVTGGTLWAEDARTDDLAAWITGLIEESRRIPGLEAGNIVELRAANSRRCLDVYFARWESGTHTVVANCHAGPNQRFEVIAQDGGFALRSMNHKLMCLRPAAASTAEGAQVVQDRCDRGSRGGPIEGRELLWRALPGRGGAIEVHNLHTGKVLQAVGTGEGSPVTQGTAMHSVDQHWWLTVVGKARHDLTQPGNEAKSVRATNPGLGDHYLRHAFGLGHLSRINAGSPEGERADGTFRLVPGKQDQRCYSLESVNFPGHFLRHAGGRLRLDPVTHPIYVYEPDATWCAVNGLSGNGVSFESWNFPGKFLRHINGEVWMAKQGGPEWYENPANFHHDTSFDVAEPLKR